MSFLLNCSTGSSSSVCDASASSSASNCCSSSLPFGCPMYFPWPCMKPRPCASRAFRTMTSQLANPRFPSDAQPSSCSHLPRLLKRFLPIATQPAAYRCLYASSSCSKKNCAVTTGHCAPISCMRCSVGIIGASRAARSVLPGCAAPAAASALLCSCSRYTSGEYVSVWFCVANTRRGPATKFCECPRCRRRMRYPSVRGTSAVLNIKWRNAARARSGMSLAAASCADPPAQAAVAAAACTRSSVDKPAISFTSASNPSRSKAAPTICSVSIRRSVSPKMATISGSSKRLRALAL